MKTAPALALAAALSLPVSAPAVEVFVTQGEYLAMPPDEQTTFVTGVYDAHAVLLDANLIGRQDIADMLRKGIRCSGAMSGDEMRDVLNRYIGQGKHRDIDSPASMLFFALSDHC